MGVSRTYVHPGRELYEQDLSINANSLKTKMSTSSQNLCYLSR
uniref:Uncharacterized protein n=1 Tax=Rhizophora mucronata TaxID=61149 RepID=A0A2P2LXD7_RHIMU